MAKKETKEAQAEGLEPTVGTSQQLAVLELLYTKLGLPVPYTELAQMTAEELLAQISEMEVEVQVQAVEQEKFVPAVSDGYEELTGELIVQSRDRSSREVWIRIPNRKMKQGEVIKQPGFAILIKEGRNGCWHSRMDYNVNTDVEDFYLEQAKAAGRNPVDGKTVILGLIRDELIKKNRLGLGHYTFIDEEQFHLVNEEDMFAAKAAEMVKVFSMNPNDPLFAKWKELMAETEKKYPLPVSRSTAASGPVTSAS